MLAFIGNRLTGGKALQLVVTLVLAPLLIISNLQADAAPAKDLKRAGQIQANLDLNLPEQIQQIWHEIEKNLTEKNYQQAAAGIASLRNLRANSGIESLEEYSLDLVGQGLKLLEEGDTNNADFLGRMALELSPISTRVIIKSIPLVTKTGSRTASQQLYEAIKTLPYHIDILLLTFKSSLYPILWALTLGLYVTFIFQFSYRIRDMLGAFTKYVVPEFRGLVAPLGTFLLVAVPCYFGPLWCVFIWSILLYLLLPDKRWISFVGGGLLILWGLLIPVRENLSYWLDNDAVQRMLQVAAGSFSKSDQAYLKKLTETRASDPVVWFTSGQLLRRYGEYDRAASAFTRAEELLGSQPWTAAQLGLLEFLRGNLEESDRLFSKAKRLGLDSSEFLYNFSRVRIAMLDTIDSVKFYTEAKKKNPVLVKVLEDRERDLGDANSRAYAEIGLPFSQILSSALRFPAEIGAADLSIAGDLMFGMSPILITICGVLLLFFFFVIHPKKQLKVQTYYYDYQPAWLFVTIVQLIPGGSWLLAGRPLRFFILFSVCILLMMPIFRWPLESSLFLDTYPTYFATYFFFVIFVVVTGSLVCLATAED